MWGGRPRPQPAPWPACQQADEASAAVQGTAPLRGWQSDYVSQVHTHIDLFSLGACPQLTNSR